MNQQIIIEVVAVKTEIVPTAKGQYKKGEVIYKNKSFQDKVETKILVDFTFPKIFNTLETANSGDVFTIDRSKNDKNFWDWVDISTGNNSVTQGEPVMANKGPLPSPKSTYETADERAARQIMIVRQSSIASAVSALKLEKAALTAEEVITMARKFEDYVLSKNIADIPEDIPFNI